MTSLHKTLDSLDQVERNAKYSLYVLLPSSISSVAQLCPTLCDLMDCSTPGLPVHPKFHINWNNSQRAHYFPRLIGKKMDIQRGLAKTGNVPSDICSLRHSSVVFGLEVLTKLFWGSVPHVSLEEVRSNTVGNLGEWLSLQGPSYPRIHVAQMVFYVKETSPSKCPYCHQLWRKRPRWYSEENS